jgi:glyoxylase-like metal-dependent hydrolase (beta-lactamase superfamily II)
MPSISVIAKGVQARSSCSPRRFVHAEGVTAVGRDIARSVLPVDGKHVEGSKVRGKAVIAILAAACTALFIGSAAAEPVRVADGVYAILGSGGEIGTENGGRTANVAFIVGSSGVVVVDTGASYRQGEDIVAAVAEVSDLPIVAAILTHPGQESIFGAAAFQARGIPVLAHRSSAELMAARCETCLRRLQSVLGEEFMANSRVVKPDRLIDGNATLKSALKSIGRPVLLIAPPWSSAPGAIAVFDETTSTLITGNLLLINRVPDIRDANPRAWRQALADIKATRCRHLIPAYGPIGTCADVDAFDHYLAELESRVAALMKEGVGLAELRNRCGLPEFARWDQYETLHPQNANRTYLRIERTQFE